MKDYKQYYGIKKQLRCDYQSSLTRWTLPRSKHWPLNALSTLENFLLQQVDLKIKHKIKQETQWSFSILLVGQNRMQQLNSAHREKNYPTDVLSFPSIEWRDLRKYSTKQLLLSLQESNFSIGDIVICKDVLLKQANQFSLSVMDEYLHLLVHGFLHLLGYDHEISLKEAKIMEKHEKLLLEGISRFKFDATKK